VRLQEPLPGGVSAALIDVADYSSQPNPGRSDIVALTRVATAPSQCPFPLSTNEGFSESTNGTFVVPPAPRTPTSKEQCKKGGWKTYGVFQNQGDCVSFVATKGKNPPRGPSRRRARPVDTRSAKGGASSTRSTSR
jgi:hypothetical protein